MTTIVTRAAKGSPLTNNEVDANAVNLKATADAALPKSGGAMTGAITTNSTFDGVDIATRDAVLTSTTTTANAALPKAGGAMTGAITTNSTFDGRDVATDGTKLDGIEASATADQTGAQIKTAYEAETNAFTDAQFTKLGGIEASATADQTAAQIKTAYESNANTQAFTDSDHTKLDGIEASADVTDTANVTSAGALMDSELTSIASVKALNQGVATGDSPTFVDVTATSLDISGNIDVDGSTHLDVVDIDGAVDMASTLAVGGVLTANAELNVNGTGTVAKFEATDGAAYIQIKDDDGTSGFIGVDAGIMKFQTPGSSFSNKLTIGSSGDFNFSSGGVINESGSSADFRVESDGNPHMLFVDGGNNRVGIGTATSSTTSVLTINDNISTAYSTTGYGATPSNSMLYLHNTNGGSNTASLINFRTGSGDGVIGFVEGGGTNDADFVIQTDGGSNGVERFRITNAGNVSIPTGSLTVADSNTGLVGDFTNTSTSGYGIRATTYGTGAQYGLAVDSYGGGYSRDFTVGADGNVNVLTGNLVIGTAGKGIDFSANGNAGGMTSEVLDDYEEGTATLTLSSTGNAPTIAQGNTFTIAYTKIGNLVRFVGYTGARNVTDVGTGAAKITGLPFTQAASYYGQVTFSHTTLFNGDAPSGYIEAGNTWFFPIIIDSTTSVSYRSGTRYMMVQGFYHTA